MRPFRIRCSIVWVLTVGFLALSAASTHAQFTWSNPAGGAWSAGGVGGNWDGGAAPAAGGGTLTTLTFGTAGTQAASYTANNDLLGTFDLNALTINNTAGTVTLSGNALNFAGTNPGISILGAGNLILNNPLNFAVATTISGAGTGNVTLGGTISGTTVNGNLIKTNAGNLTLSNATGGSMNRLSMQVGNTFITAGTYAFSQVTGAVGADANGLAGFQLGTTSGVTTNTTISGGATVNVFDNAYIADGVGSIATLTVTGAGTVFNTGVGGASGRFGIGNQGPGTLNVTNGAVVNAPLIFAARQAGATTGTVLVDGAGSILHGVIQVSMGTAGHGILTVQNGGQVRADTNFLIGRAVGANISGTVTVTGAGSSLVVGTTTIAGFADIGTLGTGTLTVSNGATMTIGNSTLGGQFVVSDGAGSTGTVNIQSGAVANIFGTSFIGENGANTTNVTLDGTGTQMNGLTVGTTTSNLQLDLGTVNFNIQNGASASFTGSIFVASTAPSTATLTVTGTNSTLSTPNLILVGGEATTNGGTGTLTVSNGGTITAVGGLISFAGSTVNVNAGGTLNVGGVADATATSFGTINIASGRTLNITDGGGGVFSGLIAGQGGIVKSGAGTQTLAGANTYSGGTTINAGTLNINNTAALGTGSVTVATGATLGGTVPVTVSTGAALSGTGTVSTAISVTGGTLHPGASPGILTATGSVTFNASSTFAVDLNGNTPGNTATNHGQLLMTGTAPALTLGGATLTATLGYTPLNTDRLFIIVQNDGAGTVSGTFGNTPGNTITIGGFTASISYVGDSGSNAILGGNDIVLHNFTPVPEPATVVGVAALGALAFRLRRRFV